jgi:hypothetical protein
MNHAKLTGEKRARICYLHRKGAALSELEQEFQSSAGSIVAGLRRLDAHNKKMWHGIYRDYSHQLYEKRREKFKRKNQRYYREVSKKRPYKEMGERITTGVRKKYGDGYGNLAEFARELMDRGAIEIRSTVYEWVRGRRIPNPKNMETVCGLLHIKRSEMRRLEARVR